MKPTRLEAATYAAQEAINRLVEVDDTFEARHRALEQLREFLAARTEQCRPIDSIGFADLLGGWTE